MFIIDDAILRAQPSLLQTLAGGLGTSDGPGCVLVTELKTLNGTPELIGWYDGRYCLMDKDFGQQ